MLARLPLLTLLLLPSLSPAQEAATGPAGSGPPSGSVVELLAAHDRSLIGAMKAYIAAKPEADDVEQAYMLLFEKAIENDWYREAEPDAQRYLEARPEGAVAPLAQIVATMARADAGQYAEALEAYESLMSGLGSADQEEFATNFADSLARKATTAGEVGVSRRIYEVLGERFGENPALRQRIEDELARLDRVGKPAPQIVVQDLEGKTLRLSDLRDKVVLVDFWATWCTPCLDELPNLQAAYDKYHARGFEIVGVSLDESVRPLVDFVQSRRLPWRQVHNATCGGDPVASFGISSLPASFLIGRDGSIVRLDPRGPALDKVLGDLLK